MSACAALSYELTGPDDAPTVVLLSSLGATRAMWSPVVPLLERELRVLRVDQRGHGSSPVPRGPYAIDDLGGDVLRLLDRLQLRRVSLCGLSLGGMAAMWLAACAPERVDRLVVLCSSAHLPPASDWLGRARTVRRSGTAAVADTVIARWLTDGFRAAHPRATAALRDMIAATPAEGYASCCEAIAELDLRPLLPSIAAPALVVAGEQDPATPPSHGAAIAEAIPGARLELVSPAAHLASFEQPEAVARLILDHVHQEQPT